MKQKIKFNDQIWFCYIQIKKRIKINKIKYGLVLVFLMIWFLWMLERFDWPQLLFIIVAVLFWISLKIHLVEFFLLALISFGLSYGILLFTNIKSNYFIFKQIIPFNYLNQKFISFVNNNYSNNVNLFIKNLILNKTNYNDIAYKTFKDLNILHLLVISGIHFYALKFVINKIFFSKKIGKFICFIIFGFYWLVINFPYPLFRVLIGYFFYKKKQKFFYDSWVKISLISLLFNLKIFLSYTFILSAGIIFIIQLNNFYLNKPKMFIWLIINLAIWLYVTLIFLPINKRFFYFSILNNFIFSFIVLTIFIFLFFTWYIVYLIPLNNWIIKTFLESTNLFVFNKSYLYLENWNSSYSQIIFALTLIIIFYYNLLNQHKLKFK